MSAASRLAFALILVLPAAGAASAAAQMADSTLQAACAGGGGVADGLLLVEFGGHVSPAERASIAREVGGRLAGSAAQGGEYVVLSAGGPPADAAADRLILREGVQSVGEAACPPPPPPPVDTATAGDTAAAPAPP